MGYGLISLRDKDKSQKECAQHSTQYFTLQYDNAIISISIKQRISAPSKFRAGRANPTAPPVGLTRRPVTWARGALSEQA